MALTRITETSLLLALLLPLAGCGQDGPARYELSGSVTYGGEPVPGGRMLFEPVADEGNSGPGSIAEIKDGTYRTRSGKGFVGGPHRVTIFGTDGSVPTESRDNALFPPYHVEVDLPRDDGEYDFEVPAQTR